VKYSPEYYEKIEQYKRAHTEGMYTRGSRDPADKIPRRVVAPDITMEGVGIMRNASYFANTTVITRMLGGERFINSVLDYGSGKPVPLTFTPGKAGEYDPSRAASEGKKTRDDKHVQDFLYPQNQQDFIEYIGVGNNFYQWDPAIPGIDDPLPPGAQWDQVWCSDVLEHIPEQDVDAVLDDLFARARISLVILISASPGKQMFRDDDYEFDYQGMREEGEDLYNIQHVPESDRQSLKAGDDLHCTVRDAKWWIDKINKQARARNWQDADGKFLRCSIKTGPDQKGTTSVRETRWFGKNPKGLTPDTMPVIQRQGQWWEDFDRILIEKKVYEMARFPTYRYEQWPKTPPKKGHGNMIYWKKTDMKNHQAGKAAQHKPGSWESSRIDKPSNRKRNADGTIK